jgi:small nuclear ribonucleoprotein E
MIVNNGKEHQKMLSDEMLSFLAIAAHPVILITRSSSSYLLRTYAISKSFIFIYINPISPLIPPLTSRLHSRQNLIFRFLQSKQKIQIWLYDQKDMRIEGRIIGFDEYMNLVLDEAEEISIKKETRKPLGRILLKGDTITLMQPVD